MHAELEGGHCHIDIVEDTNTTDLVTGKKEKGAKKEYISEEIVEKAKKLSKNQKRRLESIEKRKERVSTFRDMSYRGGGYIYILLVSCFM